MIKTEILMTPVMAHKILIAFPGMVVTFKLPYPTVASVTKQNCRHNAKEPSIGFSLLQYDIHVPLN